jgi:hypothetical protein
MQRKEFIGKTHLFFGVAGALLSWMAFVAVYLWWNDLSLRSSFRSTSFTQQFAFLAGIVPSILIGFFFGGWIWARMAKRYFHVSKQEMLTLLCEGSGRWDVIRRANERAIERLFGQEG